MRFAQFETGFGNFPTLVCWANFQDSLRQSRPRVMVGLERRGLANASLFGCYETAPERMVLNQSHSQSYIDASMTRGAWLMWRSQGLAPTARFTLRYAHIYFRRFRTNDSRSSVHLLGRLTYSTDCKQIHISTDDLKRRWECRQRSSWR